MREREFKDSINNRDSYDFKDRERLDFNPTDLSDLDRGVAEYVILEVMPDGF